MWAAEIESSLIFFWLSKVKRKHKQNCEGWGKKRFSTRYVVCAGGKKLKGHCSLFSTAGGLSLQRDVIRPILCRAWGRPMTNAGKWQQGKRLVRTEIWQRGLAYLIRQGGLSSEVIRGWSAISRQCEREGPSLDGIECVQNAMVPIKQE